MATPHIVIVGGGFGGLAAARRLARAPVHITLVDQHNYHLFQPLLYQVATAALSPGDIAAPIRHILRNHRAVRVRLDRVTAVEPREKRVVLASGGTLGYDYLILAAGARHAYFGHPEWERLAPGLKTLDDALEVRRRILAAFEAAERIGLDHQDSGASLDAATRRAYLTFVVVGGGPTGVELSGALVEIARETLAREFRSIDPREARVLLVEGSPRLLNAFSTRLSESARTQLERRGVEVRTGTTVTGLTADGVHLGDVFVPARTVLWAAGVAASPLGHTLGVDLDRGGRVPVGLDLSVTGHPEIFVVGDMARVIDANGVAVPGVCPAAMQMGELAAENVVRSLRGTPRKEFRYRDKGKPAIIGRAAGVAEFGRLRLSGFIAWVAWLFIHIYFLIGFANKMLVMMQWAWAYWARGSRSARIITGGAAASPGAESPTV